MCNTPAGLDPLGSADLGLKRHKEIPLKEQRVSRFTWFRSHGPESLFHTGSHPLLKVTYSDLTHFFRQDRQHQLKTMQKCPILGIWKDLSTVVFTVKLISMHSYGIRAFFIFIPI